MKKIIINADDFGFSHGVNKGILEAITKGVVNSTSVMVNRSAADEAPILNSVQKKISVGLHLDFTEEGMDRFVGYLAIPFTSEKALKNQFFQQTEKFEQLLGRLPDHIDSHHHVHMLPRLKNIVMEFATEHKIPVRSLGRAKFVIGFYGRSLFKFTDYNKVSPKALINLIESLPDGEFEIMCHPGYVDDELHNTGTKYLELHEAELKTLTSSAVIKYLSDII